MFFCAKAISSTSFPTHLIHYCTAVTESENITQPHPLGFLADSGKVCFNHLTKLLASETAPAFFWRNPQWMGQTKSIWTLYLFFWGLQLKKCNCSHLPLLVTCSSTLPLPTQSKKKATELKCNVLENKVLNLDNAYTDRAKEKNSIQVLEKNTFALDNRKTSKQNTGLKHRGLRCEIRKKTSA